MFTFLVAVSLFAAPAPLPKKQVKKPEISIPPATCEVNWKGAIYHGEFTCHGIQDGMITGTYKLFRKVDLERGGNSFWHGRWAIQGNTIFLCERFCSDHPPTDIDWQYRAVKQDNNKYIFLDFNGKLGTTPDLIFK